MALEISEIEGFRVPPRPLFKFVCNLARHFIKLYSSQPELAAVHDHKTLYKVSQGCIQNKLVFVPNSKFVFNLCDRSNLKN